MRESAIEKAVSQYAKKLGVLSYKFSSPGNRGVPDRIFIGKGIVLFVEFKAPGKAPTKLQLHVLQLIKTAGIQAEVIDNIAKGKVLLDSVFA